MPSVVMVSVLAFDFDLCSITVDFWYMLSKWSIITLRAGRMSNHSRPLVLSLFIHHQEERLSCTFSSVFFNMISKVITTRTMNIRKDVATKPFDEIIAEVEDGIPHLTMFGQDDLKPAPKRSRKAQRVVIIQIGYPDAKDHISVRVCLQLSDRQTRRFRLRNAAIGNRDDSPRELSLVKRNGIRR